jgi:peptidyl-prolyl cis-trans isomerase D
MRGWAYFSTPSARDMPARTTVFGDTMLGYLRKNSGSFMSNALVVFLSLLFVFFFGSSALNSEKTQVVAEVNGTKIRDVALDRRVRNQMRYLGGGSGDDERARIQAQVLDQMIERELLLQAAEREGFLVAPREVQRAVLKLEGFKDEDGNFDLEGYRKYIEKDQTRARDLQDGLKEDLLVRKVQDFIRRSVQVTPGEVKEAYVAEAADRNVEYVRVTTSAFMGEIELAEADIDTWAEENAADVRERYDRDFERKYHDPEQVSARHILLKFDDADGQDVRADLKSRVDAIRTETLAEGADFAALASKYSEDSSATTGGDLGFFDATAMVKPFSDAAFAMQPGDISEVVESKFGFHIIKVEERKDASEKKLEEVKRTVAGDLMKEEQAPELAKAFAAKLVLAMNGTMAEAERDELLSSKSLSIDESGTFTKRDRRVPKVGASPKVVTAAFALANVGDTTPEPLELPSGWAVMRLKEKNEADMAEFEEKRAQIRSRLLLTKQQAAITDWKADLKTSGKILVREGV